MSDDIYTKKELVIIKSIAALLLTATILQLFFTVT